ncbi:hypothetical protein RchiOBHm_Chr6g0306431 [Rosa chinensis]|uniref:Uncharacterized protein n=1 Tax=Rosa chinensis TaxID=74649 RepID=A0A2P6Q039_ROSCH|nr:hypothetical protein RchiOBHm_Chr6g0306431 [Rosa chinensis]
MNNVVSMVLILLQIHLPYAWDHDNTKTHIDTEKKPPLLLLSSPHLVVLC